MNGDSITFSVIVPVYNIEQYLPRCVDTVLPGLEEDDEIILSLGNSTDSSTEIAIAYTRTHKNVHVVQQSGSGLSNARNCAVQRATGTYIIYIDGDDCVETEKFRHILDEIRHNNAFYDVYMLDYYRFDYRSGKYENQFIIPENAELSGIESLNKILNGHTCFWNVWRYIYKLDFLKKNNLSFLENYLAEDIDYTTKVLLAYPSIRFLHSPYYIYFVGRKDSLMERPTIKNLKDTIVVLQNSMQLLQENKRSFSGVVCSQYQFEYFLNIALLYEIPKRDRAQGYRVLSCASDVLSTGKDPIIKLASIILSTAGLHLTAYMLHMLKKFKTKKKQITRYFTVQKSL